MTLMIQRSLHATKSHASPEHRVKMTHPLFFHTSHTDFGRIFLPLPPSISGSRIAKERRLNDNSEERWG
ncbi:hypothetical protein [Marinospirillum alkaliphilum]|uniref:hypothetical protein n=1 Tax=Marinospirillum alkaliphilum TaxID=148454 RepID=UPI00116028A3|nr:hypothetical protein [Marinospirillum alkaliphilum]